MLTYHSQEAHSHTDAEYYMEEMEFRFKFQQPCAEEGSRASNETSAKPKFRLYRWFELLTFKPTRLGSAYVESEFSSEFYLFILLSDILNYFNVYKRDRTQM